jgi:uncharacterized membrane protein YfcA
VTPVEPFTLAVAMAVSLIAAMLQGTIGFGFALLSVPVLALVDPVLAPAPQILVVIPLTIAMAVRERHAIRLTGVGYILAGRIPGAALGVLLLKVANAPALDVVVGVMILGGTLAAERRRAVEPTPRTQFVAGVVSGITGLVAAIGGPPLALLYRDRSAQEMRANLAAIFAMGLAITVGARALAGELHGLDVSIALWLLPPVALGWYLSRFIADPLRGKAFRQSVLAAIVLACVALVLRGGAAWM